MYKILVIGAVDSTKRILEQLINHNFEIVGVLGHEPINKDRVSGWVDLKETSESNNISYKGFQKINDQDNIDWALEREPDIIFAVGFSQIISNTWLEMPKLGCVGFHPTLLPKGRGRAPLAWLVLDNNIGASTFFLMGEGADDGPIFIQHPFTIEESDDATSILNKIIVSIDKCLEEWLPNLKLGIWNPIPQNDINATWYGKRGPEDGWINWNDSALLIDKLIKASTRPHPGAFTYFKDSKLIIWRSEVERNIPIKGVIGRVLLTNKEKGCLIQCGDGLLWIKDTEFIDNDVTIRVGDKLGFNIEDEIYEIKKKIKLIDNE